MTTESPLGRTGTAPLRPPPPTYVDRPAHLRTSAILAITLVSLVANPRSRLPKAISGLCACNVRSGNVLEFDGTTGGFVAILDVTDPANIIEIGDVLGGLAVLAAYSWWVCLQTVSCIVIGTIIASMITEFLRKRRPRVRRLFPWLKSKASRVALRGRCYMDRLCARIELALRRLADSIERWRRPV